MPGGEGGVAPRGVPLSRSMYITETLPNRGHNGKGYDRENIGDRKMMGQGKHILVVDDNNDVRDVVVAILQEHHYRVSAASGGSEMHDFLETGETVDCVILDVLMPGEASASLVLHLKERKIPFLLISGSFDAMKYAEDNGLQFLRKPFRSQELYSSVNTALTSGEFRQAIIK